MKKKHTRIIVRIPDSFITDVKITLFVLLGILAGAIGGILFTVLFK